MATRKKSRSAVSIAAVKHKNKRTNIPTEELRGFVAEDEARPRKVEFEGLLYARDPSLDPQLVWKGKDEQDRKPLEVPAVPIYIQEKIQPRAIIENLRVESAKSAPDAQVGLFGDFNGIEFDDLVDFYQHQQNWSNRMILGDSLLVMTSLAEKEGLKGKVQTIYLDPPYGIKFGSNWQVSTRKRDVKEGKVEDATRQPEQVKAFRDTWVLGIHSYLSYLRDRFVVARELLTESGSIFVQIGDENVHLVRSVLDEVFGSDNFVSLITFRKTSGAGSFAGGTLLLAATNDYLLWYAKSSVQVKYRQLFREKSIGGAGAGAYTWVEQEGGERQRANDSISEGRIFRADNLTSQTVREAQTTVFPVAVSGRTFLPSKGGWKTNVAGMRRVQHADRLIPVGNTLSYVRFLDDFPAFPFTNFWDDTTTAGYADAKTYVVQTNSKVVERCILMTSDPGDLILDPTSGSGTSAFVAEQLGRRWIAIDTSRVALALARTRLMTGRYPYYLLADSPEGAMREAEITGQMPSSSNTEHDVRKGFVYRRVPHITLKSIANNQEIDSIHSRFQAQLDSLRRHLNEQLESSYEDWEIPRDADPKWSADAKKTHERWRSLRRERQREIDESISRRAETEYLYDQPYEDPKKVRVTGPFTVESLSPHRLAADEARPRSEAEASREPAVSFEAMIIDNLRKSGVQNQRKKERLVFDRLETFAGTWIQAAGEYTDAAGEARRVAVSIGPEFGTVGAEQVKEAAKEALRGRGFDVLVVCGFSFDAHADESAKEFLPDLPRRGEVVAEETRLGKLPIMLARMNPDLAMGDELLKKTGSGNLFTVFGEPDISFDREKKGQLTVTIRGVDVYDPTTGQIRASSTEDIACWFIDTNYNGESFFVRHAYFTGAGDPYEKLKRALRAEIDEAAWSTLYRTTSRPFDVPKTGKIAIKVINHYGDEVMKVYEV